jgi:uncharacterized protein YkwD
VIAVAITMVCALPGAVAARGTAPARRTIVIRNTQLTRGATAAPGTKPVHKRTRVHSAKPAAISRRCRGALTLPTRSNLKLIDSAVTCLIERERTSRQLAALRPNPYLQGIAVSLAKEMASVGYFGDDTMSGQTPWQRITSSPYAVGAQVVAAGQNIGWGTGGLATPLGVVEEWMRSPPHRLIILSSGYRDVGVGAAPIAPSSVTHEKPGATYSVEFAARV